MAKKAQSAKRPTTLKLRGASKTQKSTTRSKRVSPTRQSFAAIDNQPNFLPKFPTVSKKVAIIGLIIVAILLLGYFKKNWFIAATVNGAPITNFELLTRMNQQYRTQTINQMINEKLILDEVRRNNVVVTDGEVNEKVAQLEQSFGGKETLDNLLSQQRQTREDLKRDLRLQLAIEKLYSSQATVSAEEIDTFVLESKEQLSATEAAAQRSEAEGILRQQKLSQIFNEKFQEIKAKAKITIF